MCVFSSVRFGTDFLADWGHQWSSVMVYTDDYKSVFPQGRHNPRAGVQVGDSALCPIEYAHGLPCCFVVMYQFWVDPWGLFAHIIQVVSQAMGQYLYLLNNTVRCG